MPNFSELHKQKLSLNNDVEIEQLAAKSRPERQECRFAPPLNASPRAGALPLTISPTFSFTSLLRTKLPSPLKPHQWCEQTLLCGSVKPLVSGRCFCPVAASSLPSAVVRSGTLCASWFAGDTMSLPSCRRLRASRGCRTCRGFGTSPCPTMRVSGRQQLDRG